MAEQKVGYGWLIDILKLKTASAFTPAVVTSSTRSLNHRGTQLLVPPHSVPKDSNPVSHLEFALKHQGIDLETIQAASGVIEPAVVQARLRERPNGQYLRQLAVLYEHFTGCQLDAPPSLGRYIDLFDETTHICGAATHHTKYRININGLGPLSYCPTIRRTPQINALLERDLLADLERFVESVGGAKNLDRALGWAYLDETRSTFDIERDPPSDDRARRFVQILHQAHAGMPLTEEYLASLQCSIMRDLHFKEVSFRHEQNWLASPTRTAATIVSYVPPAPAQLPSLMDDFMAFANAPAAGVGNQALMKAMLVSFGFVFNHPFLDGNGRISRFLVHHSLCRANVLQEGLILPISVAMNHHEGDYLRALKSVSGPLRNLWDLTVIDADNIRAKFNGSADPYRYWDATAPVEFGLRMAHYALDHSLMEEIAFLARFDKARKRVDSEIDIRGSDAVTLMRMAYSNQGVLSKNRRKQFEGKVSASAFDVIERAVQKEILRHTPDLDASADDMEGEREHRRERSG